MKYWEVETGTMGEAPEKLSPDLRLALNAGVKYTGINPRTERWVASSISEGDLLADSRLKAQQAVKSLRDIEPPQFKPVTQILARFRTGAPLPRESLLQFQVRRVCDELRLVVLDLPKGLEPESIHELTQVEEVEYLAPNRKFLLPRFIQSTPLFPQAWTPPHSGPSDPRYVSGEQWGLLKIDAPSAWKKRTSAEDVIVAVVDSGIDFNHIDLVDNIWFEDGSVVGATFPKKESGPMDLYGHGTHCAGVIGARGDNGEGCTGVLWRGKLMPVKIVERRYQSSEGYAACAIVWAVQAGARIINASWGFGNPSPCVEAAVNYAEANDVLIVACAGNNCRDNDYRPHWPGSYPNSNVIAVAAVDQHDNLEPQSSWGLRTVHLAAPGTHIVSTDLDNDYATHDGTSQAAPFVTGAAALILASDLSLKPHEVREIILNNVRKVDDLKEKLSSGGVLSLKFFNT